MRDMHIRKLTVEDTPASRELRLRALKEHPEAFSSSYGDELEMPYEFVESRMRQTTESPDSFILGAYQDERLVGMVGFSRQRGEKVRHNGTIWGMYVAGESQGQGIGKALMLRAIEHIRLMPGVEQVSLGVNSDNERARKLYSSLGFETYGTERRKIRVGDVYSDVEMMTLRL